MGEATRAELLARARQWHELGPVAMLRGRSSVSDAVERVRVRDSEWSADYHELRFSGMTVRDGHTGILTLLEEHFGLRPGVGELAARACALEYPDWEHAAWREITSTLAKRQDDETWDAAAALRAHPDPLHRRFGAEVLISLDLGDPMTDAPSPFEQRTLEFLLDWAEEEEHPDVLAETLSGLGHHEDPRIEPLALTYLGHPASKVRARVPATLERRVSGGSGRWTYTPMGLNAMLVLAADADAAIRQLVAHQLAESRDPSPAVGDALAELLDEEDQVTRVWAAFGLAERDDPPEGAGSAGHDRVAKSRWSTDGHKSRPRKVP